jgi:hypothetical protein
MPDRHNGLGWSVFAITPYFKRLEFARLHGQFILE